MKAKTRTPRPLNPAPQPYSEPLVPGQWTPEGYAQHLEALADKCEALNPAQAVWNRERAREIRRKTGNEGSV